MKKNFLITYLFLIFIFLFPILHILFKDKDFSSIENRPLAKMPVLSVDKIISGKFSEDLNTYLEDHFPFRNNFITLKSYYEILMGRRDINEVYLAKDDYLIEMFDSIDIKITDKNIKIINNLSNNLNVSLMLIPTSTYILDNLLPPFSNYIDQNKYSNYIENNLNNSVNFITPIDLLKQKNNEYIYYRTDHHFTTLGAYYSYLKFCDKFNITPYKITDFKLINVSNSFLGSLYSKVNLPHLEKDDIYVFEPKIKNDIVVDYVFSNKITDSLYDLSHLDNPRNQYNIFLDNNHPLIKIKTSINNSKKLLIVKDSFANSFIPFLTNHFEELHIIDLRFYSSNIIKYIEDNNLNDVLIFFNINNFSKEKSFIFLDNSMGE